MLEASNAIDRVKTLWESRTAALRESQRSGSRETCRGRQRQLEAAHQIDTSAKTVANEILTEQFDTVMPLLKELYRRLRPHAKWAEIESDFGGKDSRFPQFHGRRRIQPTILCSAADNAAPQVWPLLLAVHLSRPWCKWRSLLMDDPVQHIDDYRALNLVEVLTAIRRSGPASHVGSRGHIPWPNVLCRRLRSLQTNDGGRHVELRTSATGNSGNREHSRYLPDAASGAATRASVLARSFSRFTTPRVAACPKRLSSISPSSRVFQADPALPRVSLAECIKEEGNACSAPLLQIPIFSISSSVISSVVRS